MFDLQLLHLEWMQDKMLHVTNDGHHMTGPGILLGLLLDYNIRYRKTETDQLLLSCSAYP